jgi:hypothetical protein
MMISFKELWILLEKIGHGESPSFYYYLASKRVERYCTTVSGCHAAGISSSDVSDFLTTVPLTLHGLLRLEFK